MYRSLLRSLAVTSAIGACALALAACSGGSPHGRVISLTTSSCGGTWSPPATGMTVFDLRNRAKTTLDVELSSPKGVVAEIPSLAPGVVRPVTVTLDPGRYRWECTSVNGEIYFSAVQDVEGRSVADPSPSFVPVGSDDLSNAANTYRQWIIGQLPRLVADTDALQKAVDSGSAEAEADWLTAHLEYERLGAVYDTFGAFNDEINGRPDGLPGGVDDPKFTGFLRLEYGLWHGQPRSTLEQVAATLDTDVHALQEAFPGQILLATDLPLRAHEIIENALQFELTGDTDQGSHTNLATVGANIQGDEEVLDVLDALLTQRVPGLVPTARSQLATLAGLVDSYRSPDGTWTPVQALSQSEREQLDAATDAALATLDQIPPQLELQAGGTS